MRIFISGGCKNGKSTFAQRIALAIHEKELPLYYVATMLPADNEDDLRIKRHKEERLGCGFETVEIPVGVRKLTTLCNTDGSFLFDSVTALLANEMFANGYVIEDAHKNIETDLLHILRRIKKIVFVSDFIFSDSLEFDFLTEKYRKNLAYLDRVLAKNCDVVLEACFGSIIKHKTTKGFDDLYEKIL